jgi:hypothetical protein
MMTRLIDAVCKPHQQAILESRLWPRQTDTCPDCTHYNTRIRLLPHLDIQRCIAIHETGHAVAYVVLGCRVDAVTLRPDGTGSVEFRYTRPQPAGVWAGTAALRHMLLVESASSHADLFDVIATGSVGATSDAEHLHAMADDGIDIAAARRRADELVAGHWTAIEQVAKALLASGHVTGAEIAAELPGLGFAPKPSGGES